MTRCYVKDCSVAPVGALTHTYAPDGLIWYCADHSPSSDHWHEQTLMALRQSAERIATALEEIARNTQRSGFNLTAATEVLRADLPGSMP